MHIILLSGGSGRRLWPLSNTVRSKQFLKLFINPKDGQYESMLQRVYRQIKKQFPSVSVTIATSKEQVSTIRNQLGDSVQLSIEPSRRDTFPAIVLASSYLHDVVGVPENEDLIVCPADPMVENKYFSCFEELSSEVNKNKKKLMLVGIQPTYPSEKYGYIIPSTNEGGEVCYSFIEKPSKDKAKEYISSGSLWNGGVFSYKLGYILDKSREIIGTSEYAEILDLYDGLQKVSFDYAVTEHESSLGVVRYSGEWKDIGTWNTLIETMNDSIIGEGIIDESCANVHIINELDIPIVAMGLKDVIVSASHQGILVSDNEQSSYIKRVVDDIDQRIMFADKSWGSYRIIDVEDESLTIKVTLRPGARMNYHSHDRRNEVWTVISGNGKTVVDGMEQLVKPGDVITMMAGCKHTVIAQTELQLIEVQLGKDISVEDKHVYELEL